MESNILVIQQQEYKETIGPIDPIETTFVYLKFRQCWKGEEIRQIYLRLFLSANQHDKSGTLTKAETNQ